MIREKSRYLENQGTDAEVFYTMLFVKPNICNNAKF